MSKSYYIIPIFVPHEGCPHDCVFCNQNKITGEDNKVNEFFVRNTIEQYLTTINKENATVEVSFFGGTFTAISIDKQRELLKVAKEYKDRGIINYIRLSTRPDYIDNEILIHLKEFSVDIIELGVQSLDEEVLIKSGRGHTAAQVYDASKLIKEYEFTLGHQIMLGLPGDNFEKDIQTAKKSVEMKPEICRIYPALTIKDTMMEKMFLDKKYKPYTLEEAVEVSKEILKIYTENNIKVIRIGLQPTDNINLGGDIISGPFHAAFRELVESSIINSNIFDLVKDYEGAVEIIVHPNKVSKLYADKKRYFNKNIKLLPNVKFNVNIDSSTEYNQIYINFGEVSRKILIQ